MNLLTSLNLFTGVVGIVNIFQGDYTNTIFFILIAGFFDFLDGFAARLFGATGDFGKELDSLADVVSFGVLPSLFLFVVLDNHYNHELVPYLGLFVAVFTALRLAKFNIDDSQSDRFLGLPSPATALMISTSTQFPDFIIDIPHFFIVITIISCVLLVSNIEMMALKFRNLSLKENLFKLIFLGISLSLILILGLKSLPWIIPCYIIISIVAWIAPKRAV